MKRVTRMLATLMLAVLAVVSPISAVTSQAAETYAYDSAYDLQYMSDGGLFDPIYYARNNPDVVSVMQSSDKNVLYQHYLNYGKAEGRLPYDVNPTMELMTFAQVSTLTPNLKAYENIKYRTDGLNYVWFTANADSTITAHIGTGDAIFIYDHVYPEYASYVYYTADKSMRLFINDNMCVLTVMDGVTPSTIGVKIIWKGNNAARWFYNF